MVLLSVRESFRGRELVVESTSSSSVWGGGVLEGNGG